ncbi:unnamed protein product [Bursaphelenchus xylophilus]|nr:unnamed protein product [Bursaphelenchus xylophilus]CAG9117407.1 unnamed protein product [Bursaphelenchus xylophilus]
MVKGGLTEDYVLSLLRRSSHFAELEKEKRVEKTSVNPLSPEELGYLSVIYHCIVHFHDGSDFSFILKMPSLQRFTEGVDSDSHDDSADLLFSCHNRECQLYALLSDLDVLTPKLYGFKTVENRVKDTGYILMENFIGKAVVLGAMGHATSKQILNVASHLGKFRAEIEKLPKEEWSSLCDPFRLEIDLLTAMMGPNIAQLLEYDYDTFHPLVQKLKPFSCQPFYEYLLKGRAVELGVESLVHSDTHGGNLMFKTSPDGSISNELATFLDWQSGFSGNSLFDLARFSVVSADVDVRRGVEDEAVQIYYENYAKHAKNPNPKFTKAVCQELYDLGVLMEAIEWQILFGVFACKPNGQKERSFEASRAQMALRAKLCMEDGIRLIEKYRAHEILEKLQK